ncbi:MAG: extracellular solute-binding protein [Clostridiaceae bacterium]|nr:extracellular solute-binding protein [Clostridiaceae bacterium]
MRRKLCFVVIIAIAISLMFPTTGFADSPITATDFFISYLDVDIVEKASELNYIDEEIARYLSNPANPLDIKAAVINAVGWGYTGDNAERYSEIIFGKPLSDVDLDTIPAHDLFCIGYLMVMDNYSEPERAIPVMEKACEAFPDSFTAAMINALIKAQAVMDNADEWYIIWELVEDVIHNKDLEMDMRPEAVDIILDYMISYKDEGKPLPDEPVTVTDDNSSGPVTDKPITLTYFGKMPDENDKGRYADFYNEFEKRTNVKLSFIYVPDNIMLQKLNIMVAAGDTPDLIEFPWQRYPELLKNLAEWGIIIEMDELITRAAPNLNEIFQLVPRVKSLIMSDNDGHIYQIPGIDLRGSIVTAGPVVRGDLLKKYGLAVPETIEDWEKMLTVFRDSGDGVVPLSFDLSVFTDSSAFIGSFGIPFGFGVKDGTVFYGPLEESYMDFVTALSRWYRNGLLDAEFLILDESHLGKKINSGKVGAFIGYAGSLKEHIDALKSIDASFELIPVQNPVMQNFDALYMCPGVPVITESGIAISSRNNYPVESMKWIDYAYSKEGYRLFNFGTGEFTQEPDISLNHTESEYMPKLPEVPGYKADKEITGLKYQEQKTAIGLWSAAGDENNPSVMSPVSLTREESDELAGIMEELMIYTKIMFARFVVDGVSPGSFNEYAEEARRLGADRAIEIMQAAVDRYNTSFAELKVNGKTVETDTKPYVFVDGDMLLPVRFVVEGLGGRVAWNGKNKIVTCMLNDTVITLRINSKEVFVDYEPKTLNTEVIAMSKRTYVPASFIQDVFGVTVQWNEKTRVVNIIEN